MKPFNIAFQTESPRFDTKPTNYQPKLICGGLLPLLVTPSMHSNIKINSKMSNSCPPTPLLPTTSPTSRKTITNLNRPQSALYRQQLTVNIPTNENPCLGEESLLGHVPSRSEFGEWGDGPIEMHPEEKPRPKLDLGLQGNTICYSPRSKNRIAKNRTKIDTEFNPDTYRYIPDSNREYLLQEKSLHSIRPENLLGKQATRRTIDFVLVGQKKEFKRNEDFDKSEKKLYQRTFQTMEDITKKETAKPAKEKLSKSETLQSINMTRVNLKIEQEENKLESPRQFKIIIPLPALPGTDTKRRNVISRTGIRRFGLSTSVRPNYPSTFERFGWHTDRDSMLKGNAYQQHSNGDIRLSRPHSVIA